jgi:hypothetical protein
MSGGGAEVFGSWEEDFNKCRNCSISILTPSVYDSSPKWIIWGTIGILYCSWIVSGKQDVVSAIILTITTPLGRIAHRQYLVIYLPDVNSILFDLIIKDIHNWLVI